MVDGGVVVRVDAQRHVWEIWKGEEDWKGGRESFVRKSEERESTMNKEREGESTVALKK